MSLNILNLFVPDFEVKYFKLKTQPIEQFITIMYTYHLAIKLSDLSTFKTCLPIQFV